MNVIELRERLDGLLRTAEIADYPDAYNGLQVECGTEIERVAFAVDASLVTIEAAVDGRANLLVVHHGLFWGGGAPLTERRYRRVRALIQADVGLYSAHLPLDAHPQVGNNAVLARKLGVEIEGRFGDYKGTEIGIWGRLEMRREALAARLDELLGNRVRLIAGGPERVRNVGVITGGAGGEVAAARAAGLDAFITGEGAHHNYFDAVEGSINLYLGGHYATEVWGVRALAEYCSRELGLQTFFIDQPTGL
ncbi:MAG: Nif3-like dinuclear metal center hexameric protein [Gemmatimonas sp.]|nr:Nif3-like dinuclear metal center hexameric protein [Gemmatimonas sp.]